MYCICGHEMIHLVNTVRVHYNYETGEVTEKCTQCNCKEAIIDDSGY